MYLHLRCETERQRSRLQGLQRTFDTKNIKKRRHLKLSKIFIKKNSKNPLRSRYRASDPNLEKKTPGSSVSSQLINLIPDLVPGYRSTGPPHSRRRGLSSSRLPYTLCCCCLPCKHCTVIILVVEEILAYGNRLRFTHSKEFH